MPLTIDMTTIRVVVAMTTPSNVRKLRSLWPRNASSAIQKASRAVTHMVMPRPSPRALSRGASPRWLLPVTATSALPPRCRIESQPGRLLTLPIACHNRSHVPNPARLSRRSLSRLFRRGPAPDAVIAAPGKYALPGLINAHAPRQEERGGKPQPLEYELNIWLACGITTIRDVGRHTKRALEIRQQSAEGELAAPRIFIYPMFGRARNATEARARVQSLKQQGVDGIKILGIDRDIMAAMEDEAHK